MTHRQPLSLTDQDGLHATFSASDLQAPSGSPLRVQLEDGRQIVVPRELVEVRADGSYYLPLRLTDLVERADALHVIPVVAEALRVEKRAVETGRVRVTKVVQEREEVVDESLMQEQVDIRRVPINRVVTGPVATRQEGDTLIIPLVEEVLVVEKRLMVTEEIHITKQQIETHKPQQVTLRWEEVSIERVEAQQQEGTGIEPA